MSGTYDAEDMRLANEDQKALAASLTRWRADAERLAAALRGAREILNLAGREELPGEAALAAHEKLAKETQ